MFLLAAEVIGIVKLLKINGSIFSATMITVSTIHIILVLILSLIFVKFFPLLLKQYVLLNLLVLAMAAAADLLLLYFDGKAAEK